MLDVLQGKGKLQREAIYFHYQAPRQPAQYALIQKGWKYLRDNQEKEHLFHLQQYPYEQSDLVASQPARLAQMKEQYKNWKEEVLSNF